jgi:Flp pilus assembly pilin Flp
MSRRSPTPTAAPARAHAGQALVEYLLIISVVALLCIPAFAFLQGATGGAFDRQATGLNSAPLFTYPSGDEPCKDARWASWQVPGGAFKNQGDCESWVVTKGANAPAIAP